VSGNVSGGFFLSKQIPHEKLHVKTDNRKKICIWRRTTAWKTVFENRYQHEKLRFKRYQHLELHLKTDPRMKNWIWKQRPALTTVF